MLVDVFVEAHGRASLQIVLDLDAPAAPGCSCRDACGRATRQPNAHSGRLHAVGRSGTSLTIRRFSSSVHRRRRPVSTISSRETSALSVTKAIRSISYATQPLRQGGPWRRVRLRIPGEFGHPFRFEAGHLFRSKSATDSDLKSATPGGSSRNRYAANAARRRR